MGQRLERERGRRAFRVLGALGALSLVANGVLGVVNVRRMAGAEAWVIQAHEVLEATQELHTALRDADTEQRSYLLTGDKTHLSEYQREAGEAGRLLEVLAANTRDDEGQHARALALKPLVDRRLDELGWGLLRRQVPDPEAASAAREAALAGEPPLQEELRRRLDGLAAAEHLLLDRRAATLETRSRSAATSSVLGAAASVALIAAALRARQRAGRERQRAAALLELSLDPIVVTGRGIRIETWNRGAQLLYGFSEEEALGRVLPELLQTRWPGPESEAAQALHEKGTWTGTLRQQTKGSGQVLVSARMQLFRGAAGVERVLHSHRSLGEELRARLAERRLEEALLHSLRAQLRDAELVLAADGTIVEANDQAVAVYGWSRAELLSMNIRGLRAPQTLPEVEGQLAAATRPGGTVFETVHQRKGGGTFPVEVRSRTISVGGQTWFHSVCRDLLERQRAEDQERLLNTLVDQMEDAVITLDTDQRVHTWSPGAERLFGWRRADAVGAEIGRILGPPGARSEREALLDRARQQGSAREVVRRQRKDGAQLTLDVSVVLLRADANQVRGFLVVARDITERASAEAALSAERERSAEEQRFLAEVGRVLIADQPDFERTVEDVARLALRELADWCSVDVVEGDRVRRRIFHADPAREPLRAALERASERRSSPHPLLDGTLPELPFVRELTPEFFAAVTDDPGLLALLREAGVRQQIAVPLRARGQLLGCLSFVSSRPERRYGPRELRLAEELGGRAALALDNARLHHAAQRALRTRDEVLGVVAHDLGNLLNQILVHTFLVARRSDTAPAARDAVASITRAGRSMERLIRDLVDVARLDAGPLPVHPAPLQPGAVLAEVIESMTPVAAAGSVELRLEPAALPEVLADRDRLLQVLDNLIGNAIKFTPPGGVITLAASTEGGEVRFQVSDTGRGIAPADLPHVFERFWQAKDEHRGTGQGLSIVKAIVEGHGGRAWAESRAGGGARFCFTLPVAPRQAREEDRAAAGTVTAQAASA